MVRNPRFKTTTSKRTFISICSRISKQFSILSRIIN
uniref:Uncharacterized protein n=1 Tax=Myoviridae sp. ctCo31 TaxID=2825053 RepID=A0A8S5UMR0_9CAUD|nr:MAG TPA: hypothetical protein [Myoviridae sp. ctCo31]